VSSGPSALRRSASAFPALAAALLVAVLWLASAAAAESLDAPALTPVAPATVSANPELTWTPVARAAKYRVQVASTAAFTTALWTADVFTPSATPTADLPLGNLYWRVATYDGGGTLGAYSSPEAFTKVQAPAPALSGPADGAQLTYPGAPPVLSWSPVAGMKQYRVELDDEPTFTGATAYTTAGTSLALPSAIPSNVDRYWRVQGTSSGGVTTAWSDATDLRHFAVAWSAGAVPSLLSPASTLTADADDVTFTWTAVPGAASYEIQISNTQDFTAGVMTKTTEATQYRPADTLTQDEYYWRVRALQPNAEAAAWSTVSSFKREWLDAGGLQARPTVQLDDADPLALGTQLEEDRITVSWTPIPRAAYYELEISTDPTFLAATTGTSMVHRLCKTPHTVWTPYLVGDYTGTSAGYGPCAWTGNTETTSPGASQFITPGKTYYVRVRAIDQTPAGGTVTTLWSNTARAGESQPGPDSFTPVTDTRTTTSGTAPAVLHPVPASADTPLLSWDPVAGADTYLVALALDSGFNSPVLVGNYAVTKNTELVLDEVLLDNTVGSPYYWYVLPCTAWAGVGSGGNVCNVGPQQAINVPAYSGSFQKLGAKVAGLAGAPVQTDTVALSWADQLATSPGGGGVKSYELQVLNAANTVVDTVKTDATGYSPISKTYPDGNYTWKVRAIDAAGTGLDWSTPASFEKRASKPVLQPVTSSPAGLPLLRWSATSFAATYEVEIYRGADGTFAAGNREGASLTTAYPSATPTAALPRGDYSWRVRQVDLHGNPGPWSAFDAASGTGTFTVASAAPALSAPADHAATPAPGLVYRWAPVPGAVRYRLESTPAQGGPLVDTVTTVATSYAPTASHAGGTTYSWVVYALNGEDEVLATSIARDFTAQTTTTAPGARAAVDGATITISWTTPVSDGGAPITGYLVRYRPVGSATWSEVQRPADVASISPTGLTQNQKYEAQVAALNVVGTGPFSALASATTPTPPAVPTSLYARGQAGALAVSWAAPNPGGSPITGYIVRVTRADGGGSTERTVTATSTTLTGLATTATYTVDVAAVNAVGTGPFASAQGTTTTTAGTTGTTPGGATTTAATVLTLTGGPKATYGRSLTLTGTLRTAAGAALGSRTVRVEVRPAGSTAWSPSASSTTSATGAFSVAVLPTATSSYRAVFAAVTPYPAATSSAVAVAVATRITLRAVAKRVRVRGIVTFTGTIAPKAKGRRITLQCRRGSSWRKVARGTTSATGAFRIRVRAASRGTLACRTVVGADSTHAGGTSRSVSVSVR
jgi:hypothetical protein